MKINKFDIQIHDLNTVSDLILQAYSESGQTISYDENSKQIVKDLIETGNNFLGHENIYLCYSKNTISGLIIGYTGKSYSKVKTLFDLLIKLKLTQILNYLLVGSQLFDAIYTPNLNEDDFYISVIVVDEKHRGQGIGAFMLGEAVRIAKEKNCKKIVLDVDRDNFIAQSLYKKFGFINVNGSLQYQSNNSENNYCSMEYILN